jgi:hypothetical protein
MKFQFRIATTDDAALVNNADNTNFPANMSEDMKELLTACNKLTAGGTAIEDHIILTFESGKERTQAKARINSYSKYITGGALEMELRDVNKVITLIVRKGAIQAAEAAA